MTILVLEQSQFFDTRGQGLGIAQKLSIAIPDTDLGDGQFRHVCSPAFKRSWYHNENRMDTTGD